MRITYFFWLMISVLFPALQLTAQPTDHSPLVVAHRGFSGVAPENTMAAFEQAIAAQADIIEIDVPLTKDGHLIVMHDYSLDRTTNGTGAIKDVELAYIRSLDAGRWFSDEFAGQLVPTLDEVMKLVQGKARLLIEIKSPPVNDSMIEKLVTDHIHTYKALDWCIVQSFDSKVLENMKQLDPNIELHKLVIGNIPVLPFHIDTKLRWGSIMKYKKWAAVNPYYKFLSKSKVRRLQKRGQKVFAWTVNEEKAMLTLQSKGVDGIITNYTDTAIKLFNP